MKVEEEETVMMKKKKNDDDEEEHGKTNNNNSRNVLGKYYTQRLDPGTIYVLLGLGAMKLNVWGGKQSCTISLEQEE